VPNILSCTVSIAKVKLVPLCIINQKSAAKNYSLVFLQVKQEFYIYEFLKLRAIYPIAYLIWLIFLNYQLLHGVCTTKPL